MNIKLQTLKQKLNELGYTQYLPDNAVPLVNKILSDFIHTTERLKFYKEIANNLSEVVLL